jgi:hypothetical protein
VASLRILTDVACNGGTVVRVVGDWVSVTYGESIAGDEGCTVVLPAGSDAIADCTIRRVFSIEEAGVTTEYRILRIDDDISSPTVAVVGTPILHDLGRAPIVLTVSGLATYSLTDTTLTATQWIDNYVLPALVANGIGWVARGTVDVGPSTTLGWTRQTPLGLLRAVVANTPYEVSLRRNGTTNYLIDLVIIDKTGGVQPVAFVGRNVVTLQRSEDGDPQATVIVPQGITPAGGTRVSGIELTALTVHTTPSGATVKIKDAKNTSSRALQLDDQLNTSYADLLAYPAIQTVFAKHPVTYYGSNGYNLNGVTSPWMLNPTDSKLYLIAKDYSTNPYHVYRMDPTTMKVDGHWASISTATAMAIWAVSPSGTSGTLLMAGNTGTGLEILTFNCNAGTFSSPASHPYTGTPTNYWYGFAPWMTTDSRWVLWYDNTDPAYFAVHVTAADPPVFTEYATSRIPSVGAASPIYCSSGDKVLAYTTVGADYYVYSPSARTWAVAGGLSGVPMWMWYDSTASRAVIGAQSTNKVEWYNASSDTVTDTLADDTAQADWRSGAFDMATLPVDSSGNRYFYWPVTDGTFTMVWHRIDLTAKTRAIATGITPGKTTAIFWDYVFGRMAWFDQARLVLWLGAREGEVTWYNPMVVGSPTAVAITDSVANDGTGVSTITPANVNVFKDMGVVTAADAAGGQSFELRKNSTNDLVSEMPNAAAIASYGRILGFADGSRYGYRGERQLLHDPLHQVWETTDTQEKSPLYGFVGNGVVGSVGHYQSYKITRRATHTINNPVDRGGITGNGTSATGTYVLNVKGFTASEWIPVATQLSTPGGVVTCQVDTQANGSGNAAIPITAALPADCLDGNAVATYYPSLSVAPSWGLYAHYLPVKMMRTIRLPWIPGMTTLRVTVWYSVFGGSASWTGSNFSMAIGQQPDVAPIWTGAGTGSGTTAVLLNLTLTQTITEAHTKGPMFIRISNVGTWALWGMSAYLGPETLTEPFEHSKANDLWQFGGNILSDLSEPPIAYRLQVQEDDPARPFGLGGTVILRDPERGVAATPRIVAVTRTLRSDSDSPALPVVDLDNRPQSLVQGLVDKGSV